MDKNLLIVIFVFEILVFVWLVKEVISASYNFNIFNYVVNWIQDRPIVLPSVLFLFSPFIIGICYININNIVISNNFLEAIKNIFTPVITIITTVVSLLIVNVNLEKIKQNKQKEKIAKVIITFVRKQLQTVPQNLKCFYYDLSSEESRKRTILQKKDIPRIKVFLNILEVDSITNSSLENIGLFDTKAIEFVFAYFNWVDYWKNRFTRFIDDLNTDSELLASHIYELDIKFFLVNSYVVIAALSREFNQDNYFNDCIKEIKKELSSIKKISQDELELISNVSMISQKNKDFYQKVKQEYKGKVQQLFINVERLFNEFGLSHEIPEYFDTFTTKTIDQD